MIKQIIAKMTFGTAEMLLVSTAISFFANLCDAAETPPAVRKTPADKVTINKPIPNPVLVFGGKTIIQPPKSNTMDRYNLVVNNYQEYPAAMFAAAPNLPPCGTNKSASRTWVDIYYNDLKTQQPHRIYGFCALGSPQDLQSLWFAVPTGQQPPSPVYVVLNDRATSKQYVSNPVYVVPPPAPTKPAPGGGKR